jgi:G patch domain-containing protein 1
MPSTFVSSRSKQQKDAAKPIQQRPEDFMDEEDLADAAEARRLDTSRAFAGLGSTEDDTRRRGFLVDLFRSSGETMGIKLLKRMGWKEGQGVGPKVRRKARTGSHDDPDSGGETQVHLFAPENARLVSFVRKNDYKGLGYEGQGHLADSGISSNPIEEDDHEDTAFSSASISAKKGKKKVPSRGGFGVGVLNDTGSDDEDPYEIGPRIAYNRTIGGDKKKKKKPENGRPTISAANPLLGAKPVFISKKSATAKANSSLRKCHDGRLPLDGFVLSTSSILNQDGRYPPPDIPKDWKTSKQPASQNQKSNYISTADAAKSSTLNPASRASLLGETPLPGKSVFDYLTPSARNRLVSVTGKTSLPAALGESAPKGYALTQEEKEKELWNLVPSLDKETALKALGRGIGGWMPYADDEGKRARYQGFLELRAGLRDGLPERGSGMSKDDWVKELKEFSHAAEIFKPMTGMMATRFTSSSSQPKPASDAPASEPLLRQNQKPEDPAEAAAKLGMYGPMTRSVLQFHPTRLLCKRFNVKPPVHVQQDPADEPGGGGGGGGDEPSRAAHQTHSSALPRAKLEILPKSSLDDLIRDASLKTHNQPDLPTQNPTTVIVVDTERNEALEAERAGDAVFKAIFGSDDDDDDDDDD